MTALDLGTVLDLGTWAAEAVGGSMLVAIPVAMLAGLISFFSPCVLPLLPGYLSYATGLSAAQVIEGKANRGRMLAGTGLFVLGFATFFALTGALAGTFGRFMREYAGALTMVLGVLSIVLGLIFAGVIPLGQRDLRIHRVPAVGVAVAPLLGLLFGLGWTPCIGPTLSVVLTLSMHEASAVRGGVLSFVYALGLGVPFIIAGLAFTRFGRTVDLIKRHQRTVLRIGGALMVAVGIALLTGLWDIMMGVIRGWAAMFGTVI